MGVPTTPVLDTFNRANEEPAANWQDNAGAPGGLKIASNVLAGDTTNYCVGYYTPLTFTVPCENYITVLTSIGGGEIAELSYLTTDHGGVSPIRDSNKDGYVLLTHFPASNQIGLYRRNDNALTLLGAFSWTIANGDSYLARVVDGLHSIYAKASAGSWTLIGNATDNTWTSGRFMVNTGAGGLTTFEDFGGGTVTGVLAPPNFATYPRPVLRTV